MRRRLRSGLKKYLATCPPYPSLALPFVLLILGEVEKQQAAFDANEEKLKKQIAKVIEELKAQRVSGLEDEVQLRRRKIRGEVDVDAVIKNYDTATLEMVDEFGSQVTQTDER